MKLSTIRNLRALIVSRQFSFTGDQLPALLEIVSDLAKEELLLSEPPLVAVVSTPEDATNAGPQTQTG